MPSTNPSTESSIEVTHEDFRQRISGGKATSSHGRSARKFGGFKRLLGGQKWVVKTVPAASSNESNASVRALPSASSMTVASVDTVKASNRIPQPAQIGLSHPPSRKRSKGWEMFKKRPARKDETIFEESDIEPNRPRAQLNSGRSPSPDKTAVRRRFGNDDSRSPSSGSDDRKSLSNIGTKEDHRHLDDAIRGRLDGMDILSLGSARLSTVPPRRYPKREEDLNRFIATMAPKLTNYSMVSDMIHISAGRDPPEIVLEGYFPGGDYRWLVRMEENRVVLKGPKGNESPLPSLSPTDDEDCGSSTCDDGSSNMSIHQLLESMWGNSDPPPPSHVVKSPSSESGDSGDDDVMQLAAACSVPIDIDEDTFIVDNASHLQSIHDIAAVRLRRGKFRRALDIFQKILKGFQMRHEGNPHYLIGVALHNIGVIEMWQGRFSDALEYFSEAVAIRTETLPAEHPDIAVSLARKAMCHFALGQVTDSIVGLETALQICTTENVTRAKILNNLGVVHYCRHNLFEALKRFASALKIQRKWLEGPVRRDSIIFDASITLGNMGRLYLDKDDLVTAFHVFEEALLLQTTTFRNDHDVVLVSLGNLAYAKAMNTEYKRAIQIYRGILMTQEHRFGQCPQTMETLGILGFLYIQHRNDEEALKCFSIVYKWQLANMDTNHPCVIHTKETIKRIEDSMQGEVSVWI